MTTDRRRLQFDFTKDAIDRLDSLAKEIDAPTRAEVLRNSMRLYEWLVMKAKQGKDLQVSADELRVITGIKS